MVEILDYRIIVVHKFDYPNHQKRDIPNKSYRTSWKKFGCGSKGSGVSMFGDFFENDKCHKLHTYVLIDVSLVD